MPCGTLAKRSIRFGLLALVSISTSFFSAGAFAQIGNLQQPLVVSSGRMDVGGWVQASRFEVVEGSALVATDDLFVECEGPIVIDGTLLAISGQPGVGNPNAVSIALVLDTAIVIRGNLVAGHGADGVFPGRAGGHETSIYLEAPTVVFEMEALRAGNGGQGGPGARGGNGGDILVSGAIVTSTRPGFAGFGGIGGRGGPGLHSPDPRLRVSGDGGRGGHGTGGAGGPGGDGGACCTGNGPCGGKGPSPDATGTLIV